MPVPACFWCPTPALLTVEGVSLCATHARCASCQAYVTTHAFTCRCEKYGNGSHEQHVYCSQDCLEDAHAGPEPDWDDQALNDTAEEAQG